MRTLGLAIAAGAIVAATQANAGGFPVNSMTGVARDLIGQVAVHVYVHEGHRYCFYFDGWHGPGWYRCGFAFRRGLGWGGIYGWNDWSYGPYERRLGGRHHYGERMGVETRSRQTTGSVETRTRSTMDSRIEGRTRSTTGSGVEGGTRMRGGTTGSALSGNAHSASAPKVQGSTGEGASIRGGGNVGGGPTDEGNSKRQ
jgi:hypothetical protein